MSSSKCCFLICIQISQEAGQEVWYSHLLKNFPKFVVIHTVKGFGVVNKAKVDAFLEFSCFISDPVDTGNLIWVPLPFLNPAWTSGSSQFTYCWSLAWRILSITLLEWEMSAMVQKSEHSLALPFFGIRMKIDLFQSCGHYWVSHICWHIECINFTASSFRILNSLTGISSLPLALFIVMLPKAHLTSHSRISCSRWVITTLWLSGLWKSFLYSSVYSCHLFLIFFPSLRFTPFLSFIVLSFAWNVPLVSALFLKRSLLFPILFSSMSLHWSLRKAFLSLLAILWNSAFK